LPKGPSGQKRPADVVGNAGKIARIATGEDQDEAPVSGNRRLGFAWSLAGLSFPLMGRV
jgi:hypothetical protein